MREFNPDFENHLVQQAQTLCWCWDITRKDGRILGFTTHDRALQVDGRSYEASSAFIPADLEQKLGAAFDNSAAQIGLNSAQISPADIAQGLFDSAQIRLLCVNWAAPDVFALMWSGQIGAIKLNGQSAEFELTGPAENLRRSTGRVFSRLCDASFGDGRCGIDRGQWPEGTVCPRTFEACKNQFANAQNFRGFPFLLSDDAMQQGPEQSLRKDGTSRFAS